MGWLVSAGMAYWLKLALSMFPNGRTARAVCATPRHTRKYMQELEVGKLRKKRDKLTPTSRSVYV